MNSQTTPLHSISSAHKARLSHILSRFHHELHYVPVIGAELEFYLTPSPETEDDIARLSAAITAACEAVGTPIGPLEKERGHGQFEVQMPHHPDIEAIAEHLTHLPTLIKQVAEQQGYTIELRAKPYADQPGNSLHIHISLCDPAGNTLMMREGEERQESAVMLHAIGGLLATMQESMRFFAPTAECYQRFTAKHDAPTTVSWGGNNRTVALRIPASSWVLEDTRHIEHRVSSSCAHPYEVITAILVGIYHGLTHQLQPAMEKTYGDAALPIYALPALANSLEDALKRYEQGTVLKPYYDSLHILDPAAE